jgi:hypothetical protein
MHPRHPCSITLRGVFTLYFAAVAVGISHWLMTPVVALLRQLATHAPIFGILFPAYSLFMLWASGKVAWWLSGWLVQYCTDQTLGSGRRLASLALDARSHDDGAAAGEYAVLAELYPSGCIRAALPKQWRAAVGGDVAPVRRVTTIFCADYGWGIEQSAMYSVASTGQTAVVEGWAHPDAAALLPNVFTALPLADPLPIVRDASQISDHGFEYTLPSRIAHALRRLRVGMYKQQSVMPAIYTHPGRVSHCVGTNDHKRFMSLLTHVHASLGERDAILIYGVGEGAVLAINGVLKAFGECPKLFERVIGVVAERPYARLSDRWGPAGLHHELVFWKNNVASYYPSDDPVALAAVKAWPNTIPLLVVSDMARTGLAASTQELLGAINKKGLATKDGGVTWDAYDAPPPDAGVVSEHAFESSGVELVQRSRADVAKYAVRLSQFYAKCEELYAARAVAAVPVGSF